MRQEPGRHRKQVIRDTGRQAGELCWDFRRGVEIVGDVDESGGDPRGRKLSAGDLLDLGCFCQTQGPSSGQSWLRDFPVT